MAIGDYNKTTYVNGVAPAINATNLNNNENKVKELDTAVESIEVWQENEKSVSTESRIFDLTGDRVPAIPDDPAGVTYFQDAWATTDGWTGARASVAVSGGKLIATCTDASSNYGAGKNMSVSPGLVSMRFRASTNSNVAIYVYNGTTDTMLTTKTVKAGVWENISAYISSSNTAIYFRTSVGISIGGTTEVDWAYIGTGAYLSKTVDRAGVPWTNYGALPVPGPFGKGLKFNGAQYLQAPGPMIGASQGTLAVIMRRGRSSVGTVEIPVSNHDTMTRGVYFRIDGSNNSLTFSVRKADGGANNVVILDNYTDTTNIKKFVVTWSGLTVKTYVDGVLATMSTLSEPIIQGGDFTVGKSLVTGDFWFVGEVYNARADSRVWTDEEIARWSRDPYSEESIPMSSTPSANALVQWPASGNFGSGSNFDADTVDGYQASQFPKIQSNGACINISNGNIHDDYPTGFYMGTNVTNGPDSSWNFYEVYRYNTGLFKRIVAYSLYNRGLVYTKSNIDGTWGSWVKIWNEGNVGTNWATALAANYGSMARIPISTKTGTGTGTAGDIAADSSYLYVCTATNTWKRVALSAF